MICIRGVLVSISTHTHMGVHEGITRRGSPLFYLNDVKKKMGYANYVKKQNTVKFDNETV
jgi:hypothetical protein